MDNIPIYVSIVFLMSAATVLGFVYYAVDTASADKKSLTSSIVITFVSAWLFIIALLSFYDFFTEFDVRPPRLIVAVIIPAITITLLFVFPRSKAFLHKIPLTTLTYIHIVRIPIEMVLWWLALEGKLDMKLTFEGINYDILVGISAPFVAVFLVGLRSKSKFGAGIWNVLSLLSLFLIVKNAIQSTPYFFSSESFLTPNIAVFYFPYIWLPTFIVPVVLLSHLISLYKIFTEPDELV